MAFIHGPLVEEVPLRGAYGKPNRNGACVRLDGSVVEREGALHMLKEGRYSFSWLDCRDVETNRDTLPGAHRGGTHRHEFCLSGARIGFTYDDFLLPQYDRTIGYMEPHAKAPKPASHYFAVLVVVKPKDTSNPGELEKAYGDSWSTRPEPCGLYRQVRNPTESPMKSRFRCGHPLNIDITTATRKRIPLSGTARGPQRCRLTHDWAGGIVRGAPDGKRIAYYGKDKEGRTQVFIINANVPDKADDTAMHPKQATFLRKARKRIAVVPGRCPLSVSDSGLVVTSVRTGTPRKSVFLNSPKGTGRTVTPGYLTRRETDCL